MRLLVLLILFSAGSLYSHDSRKDKEIGNGNQRKFKLPSEVISSDKLNRIYSERDENPDARIESIKQVLNDYYTQFIEDKATQDDREKAGKFKDESGNVALQYKNNSGTFPVNSDPNSVRLLINNQKFRLSESHLIRDSEILYRLHSKLAELYETKKNLSKAIESYTAALRYRNYSNTEERFLQVKEKAKEKLSESPVKREYDSSVLVELSEEERNLWLNYKSLKEENEKLAKDLQDAEDRQHVIGSRFATGEITAQDRESQEKTNLVTINSLRESKNKKSSEWESFQKEKFEPFLKKKNREDSSFILKFANAIKQSENENKDRLKVRNKADNLGQSVFVVADTNKNSNFPGYTSMVEFALRIDPENETGVRMLADEFRSSGKKKNAIDYYIKYLKLVSEKEASKERDAETYQVYRHIAGLYTEVKQYVLAASYYDKLSIINKERGLNDSSLYYQLGEFYQHRIGDHEKSSENFKKWLETRDEKQGDSVDTARSISMQFNAHFGISVYYRQMQNPEEEAFYLGKAYGNFKSLQDLLKSEEEKVSGLRDEANKIKKELLTVNSDSVLNEYREAQNNLEEGQSSMKSVRASYDSIRKTNMLFRMTSLEEDERNFKKAKELFQEIVNVGNENEVNTALRNIERIRKTEVDGILRKRIVH